MWVGSRWGALAERPFRLLWLGQTTSAVGDALVPLALTFAVLEVGGAKGLGLSLAALMGTRAVLVLVGGVWADRLPRRMVMLSCDLLRAAVEFTTVVVIVTGHASTWFFVCTSALFGAAAAFFSPASTGLIPQVVSSARLQQANALVSLSRSTISVFGPAVSGLIVVTAGAEWVFGINGASFVISALFLARLAVAKPVRGPRKPFFSDLAEGWREVRSRPWVAAALVNFSIVNIGIASYFVLGPLIVEEELSGASTWAIAMTGGSIGGIVGSVIALRFKPTYPLRWAFGLIILTAIQLLGLIPPLPAVGLGVLALLTVASIQISGAFWNTILQQRIPEHVLSRVVAYDWLVSLVFMPLGYIVAAPLSDTIGTDTTLLALAALSASACVGALLVPGVRNMRRADADPTTRGDPAASVPARQHGDAQAAP
jgi:MFS family permease